VRHTRNALAIAIASALIVSCNEAEENEVAETPAPVEESRK
jgi:hypothetical protein